MSAEVPLQVVVRVRPLIGHEINLDKCLHCAQDEATIVIGNGRNFSFDQVFNEDSTQEDIYEDCVHQLVRAFFDGYNTTVFTYGHTGSGKTYTMGTGNCVYLDEMERGIIPRAISDVFDHVEKFKEQTLFKMRISFIEIYKEEITDLLDNSTGNLVIREDELGNTVVVGASEETVSTFEEVLTILDAGTALRHVGQTNVNDLSSRSHCIFTLMLDQCSLHEDQEKGNVLSSRFHFVDLAGSERAHRTGNQGERFKESISINNGLLALSNVICALSDQRRKSQHVPYRESKLTRILKDSLGGNSRTVMITCLSPALADLDENINSLKYATRAKTIKNKPKINWDIKSSKLERMQTEIEMLKSRLKRRDSDQTYASVQDIEKLTDLEAIRQKYEIEQGEFIEKLHEANSLLKAIEVCMKLPTTMNNEIEKWRKSWENNQATRPLTAPSRRSVFRRPENDVIENLRAEVSKYKAESEARLKDVDEIRHEMIVFGEENARLRLELDIALNSKNELQEKLVEQQISLQQCNGTHETVTVQEEKQPSNDSVSFEMTAEERLLQTFRAKSNLLVSKLDDMDEVEHDEDISSDDDNDNEDDDNAHNTNTNRHILDEPPHKISKRLSKNPKVSQQTPLKEAHYSPRKNSNFTSNIPVPVKSKTLTKTPKKAMDNPQNADVMQLTHRIDTARQAAKLADIKVINTTSQLKELKLNIKRKEELIGDLTKSEKAAKETLKTFEDKLDNLTREYQEAKSQLEEAHEKLMFYEKENNLDQSQKRKLDSDYQKKLNIMQKKLDDLNKKQTVQKRLMSYQEVNEKKVKDLEACISRLKNQHIELERKLRTESEKKNKLEQESQKNELKIKELEMKTNKQEKLLKRKTEEVASAQRKLRTNIGSESAKLNDHLEKKKLWLDNEIEKVLARQEQIEQLENELQERDESLKKREALLVEKDILEVKKTKSNESISKNKLRLSVQVEQIDEQLHSIPENSPPASDNKYNKLLSMKADLEKQLHELENEENVGLEPYEERRLIELDEALDALDEAISFKNNLINQRQTTLKKDNIEENTENIFEHINDFSNEEYKHLLNRLFVKVIQLRSINKEHEDARCHFELQVSSQEKRILDLEHMQQVMEARNEQQLYEMQCHYEQEMKFLVEQLSVLQTELASKESNILMKKIKALEKDLYYYKMRARKYKDQLKDFSNDVSTDHESNHNQSQHVQESGERKGSTTSSELHFPPVHTRSQKNSMESSPRELNFAEHQRLQEIFRSKPTPKSPKTQHKKKDDLHRKQKLSSDLRYIDSIEPSSFGKSTT